ADGECSIGADLADIASSKPPVHKGVRRGGRIAPVASEDLAAFQLDFVKLAEANFHARERISHAARLAGPLVWVGDDDAALRYPVTLQHGLSQDSLAALEEGCGQRCRARDEESNLPQVGRIAVEVI